MQRQTHDFIVTTAGSAGAVVAARLPASGRHGVLLLNAGPPDTSRTSRFLLGFAKTSIDAANFEPAMILQDSRLVA